MKDKFQITVFGNDGFKCTRTVEAFNFSEAVEMVEVHLAPFTIEKFIKIEAKII